MRYKQFLFVSSLRRDGAATRCSVCPATPQLRQTVSRLLRSSKSRGLVTMDQVHGKTIRHFDVDATDRCFAKTDGLMTATPGTVLIARTADCVPVILMDPRTGVVACLHAGWKGILKGIVPNALRAMSRVYGVRLRDVHVYMGPSIRKCCYRCSAPRIRSFRNRFGTGVIYETKKGATIDLPAAVMVQLRKSGVTTSRIRLNTLCTACSGRKKYFSFRCGDGSKSFITAVLILKKR